MASAREEFEKYSRQKEEVMHGRRFVVLAFLTFALTFGLARPWRMQAQDKSAPSTIGSIDPYLMDRDAEIAMARSAGPNSVSSGAKVLVLGRHGYETAVEGKNDFVCLVGRSWDLPKNNPAFWDPRSRCAVLSSNLAQKDGTGDCRTFEHSD